MKGDHRAIRREVRESLDPDPGCEAVGVAAVAADDPEIVPIVEDDLRLADRGKTQQERGIGLSLGGLQEREGEDERQHGDEFEHVGS